MMACTTSVKKHKSSKVWQYFSEIGNAKEERAKCDLCVRETTISVRGGSTKGLLTHLSSKHLIAYNGLYGESSKRSCDATEENKEISMKKSKVTHFFGPLTSQY